MNRFTIRRYSKDDVYAIYAAADESREHVARWMGWMTPEYSKKDAAQWVSHATSSWQNEASYEHVIVDAATQKVIGSCGLNHLNKIDLVCNLGYWVSRSYLGRGAAVEAVLALKEFAFDSLGYARLEIVVAESNHASYRVAEKSGAIHEGIHRARLRIQGLSHPAHIFALINPKAEQASTGPLAAHTESK